MVTELIPQASSAASVMTGRPGRYGKQLVAHLSRRATGTWDPEADTGVIDFATSQARLSCTATSLEILLTAAPADLDRMEAVVGSHLVRFGSRDELVVEWVRADGSQGSSQRKDED